MEYHNAATPVVEDCFDGRRRHVLTNVETQPTSGRARSSSPCCFNGATSSRTWKLVVEKLRHDETDLLQWSHVLTNVETAQASGRHPHGPAASMEPRPHERGNHSIIAEANARLLALQWSHVLTNVETIVRRWPAGGRRLLQWSHVLTNVETQKELTPVQRPLRFNGATSSRTWKRRADRLGRPADLHRFNGATSSRTWKRREFAVDRLYVTWLQWSHVLTNVETYRRDEAVGRNNHGFNGATSSRTWKLADERRHDGQVLASMEPRPHERGNARIVNSSEQTI